MFVAPRDYTSTNRSISPSRLTNNVDISINDDRLLEGDEQFSVLLQLSRDRLACGIILGRTTMATVNIIDNDGTLLSNIYHLN